MKSQVKSQISDKVYETTLDDLSESDQGLEVDLYKLIVFNKDIMSAPGTVMSDDKKDVHYCYVYVIKNGKVSAKLGIYETHLKSGEIYDLTEFEGREFLLFDHYYNEPGSLVEFEMKEEVQPDNIFDYLKRFLKPVTNATAAIKEQAAIIRKITKRLDSNFPDQKQYSLKVFKKQKPYDGELLDSFKEDSKNWMFNLIVLETVFNIKFIFENSDGSEDEIRNMVRSGPNESTTIIRVSLEDTPRHVANNAPKTKAAVEEELVPRDTFPSPEDVGAEESKGESYTFTSKPPPSKAESATEREDSPPRPKLVRSFTSKPPSKAESATEREDSPPRPKSFTSKAPSKAESATEREDSPPRPKSFTSKAESKAPSKAESATEREDSPPRPKPVRSFTSKPSVQTEISPLGKTSEVRADSPPRPPPSLRKTPTPSDGTSKPKRIVRATPPTKLKNVSP